MDVSSSTTSSALSRDGRTFTYDAGGGTSLLAGDIVMLRTPEGRSLLGQVIEPPPVTSDAGQGLLIGEVTEDGSVARISRFPFASASLVSASPAYLSALQSTSGASLPVGMWRSCDVETPALVRPQGFGRHTFLCGQSGSGKTYALGVILEQLLLGTALRMVVLDPNADFVGLRETRPDAPAEALRRLGRPDIRVLGSGEGATGPLRMRFATMPRQAQAAVLQLDPLKDRGEYNHFLHLIGEALPQEVDDIVKHLRDGGPDENSLAQRIENLGLPTWSVWAAEQASALEVVGDGSRATVLDLSGFRTPHESLAVSLDVIEGLWAQRESRTPTLIVVDEAHNICPAQPSGSLQAALVERLAQIAAEGRKYGLWLLLSTQRPSKIHPQILSQCDNLVLMRMNSPADLEQLAETFGFAPRDMLAASKYFVQGEALLAGNFVPVPSMVRMGSRLTREGGVDVRVPVS